MNLTGFQVVRKRKPVSFFYYFLASLFINETIYLILTEIQAPIIDHSVSFLIYLNKYSKASVNSHDGTKILKTHVKLKIALTEVYIMYNGSSKYSR